jgi:hypothetical protein
VEMKLSLMYDLLYTKAAVIHNWYGYCIRVFSLLSTIIAFILLQLSGNKDGYSKVDVAITYILLVGAFLLDMVSVLSALGSAWTCNLCWSRGWRRLGNVILSLRRYVKAAKRSRGWSGSIGQFNLFHFCSRDKTKLSIRLAKMVRLEDWWNNWHYSNTVMISDDVKELVFKHVWQLVRKIHDPHYKEELEDPMAIMPLLGSFIPELYDETVARRKKFDDALNLSGELQKMILTWHIFTNVSLPHIRISPNDESALSAYVKAIKALSDYMVFLITICPDMTPGVELRIMNEAIRDTLEDVWLRRGSGTSTHKKEENLASILQGGIVSGQTSEPILIIFTATGCSHLLSSLLDTRKFDKSDLLSSSESLRRGCLKRLMPDLESSCRDDVFDTPKALELILDAWVRLLVLASVRSSKDAHVRQISCGGELTTIVWLMEEHASVFFKPPKDNNTYNYRMASPFSSEDEDV